MLIPSFSGPYFVYSHAPGSSPCAFGEVGYALPAKRGFSGPAGSCSPVRFAAASHGHAQRGWLIALVFNGPFTE